MLDKICGQICKENQPFERLEMTKKDLLDMFAYNQFKCRIIQEKVTTPTTTVYRCGPLIDLCRGPHVRHTGKLPLPQSFCVHMYAWFVIVIHAIIVQLSSLL